MTSSNEPKPSRLSVALSGKPARTVATRIDESFDREVDDELQREWLARMWDQFSGYILGAAVAIVLGVGAYKLYEHRGQAAAEAAGASYMAAVKDFLANKPDQAVQQLAVIAKSNNGFGTLAKLRLAAADAGAGRTQDAIAKYDALARDKTVDPMLAGFAQLQTAMLKLDTASFDEERVLLEPLATEENPWRQSARELIGMAAMKAGKTAEARTQFERLASDMGVPPGIAERARIVMGSIIAAELASKAANPAKQPPAAQAPIDAAPVPPAPAKSAGPEKAAKGAPAPKN